MSSSNVLQAGPAPHWRARFSRRVTNLVLILGLMPAVAAATFVFGWAALGRFGLAAGAAVLVERITQHLMRQPERIGDLSAVVQGLLLALLLPPTVPWWLILMGVAMMIVVGKQLFGGVGGYPVNPVLVGWALLLLSWGNRIYPVGEQGLLGTAWVPAIWIGGFLVMVSGHVKWQAPIGMLVGVCVAALALEQIFPGVDPVSVQLGTGSVMLGAFFLASDPTCSPANYWPRLLFGLGAGILVVLLRLWGAWPEPIPFALMLMNLTTPLLDRIRPKPSVRITSHA